MEYSFKDILSGLRQEYINMKIRLKNLQKEFKILDTEISKVLVLLNNDTSGITSYFYNKKHLIDASINIIKKLDVLKFKLENLKMDNNIKSIYYFQNDLLHYHVIIENIHDFMDQTELILNSSFIGMMKPSNKHIVYNGQDYSLNVGYNNLSQEKDEFKLGISSINYYPLKDFVKFDYLDKLDVAELNHELNIKYPKTLFNDNQREVIEKHKKDIIVLDKEQNTHEFKILEEEQRLVLIKR